MPSLFKLVSWHWGNVLVSDFTLSKIDASDILSCDSRNISWLCEAATQSEEVQDLRILLAVAKIY